MVDPSKKMQHSPLDLAPDEAKFLFYYHLEMAAKMFELLPDGYSIPLDLFDEYSENAARAFYDAMEVAYDGPTEDSEDE
jgi:hypothetical protein